MAWTFRTDSDSTRTGIALFVVSAAAIVVESATIKLFRIEYLESAQFLVIAGAMFGMGVGGAASLVLRARDATRVRPAAVAAGVMLALSMFLVGYVARPSGSETGFTMLVALALLSFIAFGAVITILFRDTETSLRWNYFGNMSGSGAGAALLPLLVAKLGLEGALVFVAGALCAVAALLAWRSHRSLGVASLLVCATVSAAGPQLAVPRPLFGLDRTSQNARYELTRFNGFSRLDVRREETPVEWALGRNYRGPRTLGHGFSIDGIGARYGRYSSFVTDQGDWNSLSYDITALPERALVPGARILVVGSGGGKDVASALSGTQGTSITAVEINPLVIDVMHDRFPDAYRAIYDNPRVELHIDDIRAFLARDTRTYDLIEIPTLWVEAVLSGAAAQLETNYLYTVEALRTYFDHLSDAGLLSIAWYRNTSNFNEAVLSAAQVTQGPMQDRQFLFGSGTMGLLVLSKAPLPETRRLALFREAQSAGFERQYPADAATPGLRVGPIAQPGSQGEQPMTDDRPFAGWLMAPPALWRTLIDVACTAIVALLVLAGYRRRLPPSPGGQVKPWSFFVGIGIGYVSVELYLIQKLSLFIGDPLLSFAVVLSTLLVANGLALLPETPSGGTGGSLLRAS